VVYYTTKKNPKMNEPTNTKFKCPHCGESINPGSLMGKAGGLTTGDAKRRDTDHYRAIAAKRWEIARAKEGK